MSSNEEAFNNAKKPYQEALKNSGYEYELKYEKPIQDANVSKSTRKNRARNILWYNPPFSKNVKTNVGKEFISIVKRNFTSNHPLHKIFNPNTVKLSYSCTPNVKNIIDSHNKKIRQRQNETNISSTKDQQKKPEKTCNCRKPAECPLNGNCLEKSVIYQATITNTDDGSTETYIGLTKNEFKERFNGHKSTFRHSNKRNSTELSKHVWRLKDSKINFNIKWKILRKSKPYCNKSKTCRLCLLEKFYIICKPELGTLNKRNELASSCRHKTAFLYKNFKT